MIKVILITIGPIAVGLLAVAVHRLREMMSLKSEEDDKFSFPGTEDDARVRSQMTWRRSYAK